MAERIPEELGLEAYLPLKNVRRRWSDRIKYVQVPLIPSYVFVKMREKDIHAVRNVQGVVGFITFPSSGIAPIPDHEIEALRQLAESMENVHIYNTSQLKLGANVQIAAGPFAGMKGAVTKECPDGNFSIKISGLNISLVIDVQPAALEVIP